MVSELRTLYQYRELLWSWTQRNLKVRYKQTVLGTAGGIIQPLTRTTVVVLQC